MQCCLLTVGGDAVRTRTTFCRAMAAAGRAQSDAHIMPQVPRRTPKHPGCLRVLRRMAAQAVRRRGCVACVACNGGGGSGRHDGGGRTSSTACVYLVSVRLLSAQSRAVFARSVSTVSSDQREISLRVALVLMDSLAPPTSSSKMHLAWPFPAARCSAVYLPTRGGRRIGRRSGRPPTRHRIAAQAHAFEFPARVFASARAARSAVTIAS
jgi:hypothetical protein